MSAIRVGIAGGYGRMGRAVSDAIAGDEEFELATLLVSPGWLTRVDNGSPLPSVPVVDNVRDFVQQSDVVTDFTTADVMLDLAPACADHRVALVSGTTGIGEEHHAAMDLASNRVAVLWSPNMSAGIAAIMALLPGVTSALSDYDIEIIETHHRGKRDAPSGTALALASRIEQQDGASAVTVHSVRAGGNPGTHSVIFGDTGDELTITHRANGRECYARGALRAARFVVGRPPGLFTMADVITPVAV
jgi:4-hydroxy-tetrahydrodipicolinate reductase